MFRLIGALLVLYTLFAAINGEVYAKSGVWGRTIRKADEPTYFWIVIGIYAALSIALFVIF
jgi:hypothetical protein